jgi:hypothetical protein
METIYVTFAVPHLFRNAEKFAVKCNGLKQAQEVASDAHSLHGVMNIRFRKCNKPSGRLILDYNLSWDICRILFPNWDYLW